MISEAILITIITAVVGPAAVLYIAKRIKNIKPRPDRIDSAFDRYDAIVKWQDEEIKRLSEENAKLRGKDIDLWK